MAIRALPRNLHGLIKGGVPLDNKSAYPFRKHPFVLVTLPQPFGCRLRHPFFVAPPLPPPPSHGPSLSPVTIPFFPAQPSCFLLRFPSPFLPCLSFLLGCFTFPFFPSHVTRSEFWTMTLTLKGISLGNKHGLRLARGHVLGEYRCGAEVLIVDTLVLLNPIGLKPIGHSPKDCSGNSNTSTLIRRSS